MAVSSRHGQLLQGAFQARAEEAQTAAKQARYHAMHDEPSRLPNGEYFRARLAQALGRSEPPHQALAVLYISLDLADVQPSIDARGPEAADRFMVAIAAGLAAAARAEDMLGRLGPDTFGCLAPGLSKRQELGALANKLIGSMPSLSRIGDLQLCVRPRIGIAIYPRDGTRADALLSNAEFAMHRAKERHAGHTFVDEG